jgi:hypothetical protein
MGRPVFKCVATSLAPSILAPGPLGDATLSSRGGAPSRLWVAALFGAACFASGDSRATAFVQASRLAHGTVCGCLVVVASSSAWDRCPKPRPPRPALPEEPPPSGPRVAALSRVARSPSVGCFRAGQLALHKASTVCGCGASAPLPSTRDRCPKPRPPRLPNPSAPAEHTLPQDDGWQPSPGWPARLRSGAFVRASWPCTRPRPCAVAAPLPPRPQLGTVAPNHDPVIQQIHRPLPRGTPPPQDDGWRPSLGWPACLWSVGIAPLPPRRPPPRRRTTRTRTCRVPHRDDPARLGTRRALCCAVPLAGAA